VADINKLQLRVYTEHHALHDRDEVIAETEISEECHNSSGAGHKEFPYCIRPAFREVSYFSQSPIIRANSLDLDAFRVSATLCRFASFQAPRLDLPQPLGYGLKALQSASPAARSHAADRWRDETVKPRIYFDNSATTRVDEKVLEAMIPFFRDTFGNASSLHPFVQKARAAVEDSRRAMADLLGTDTQEIVFTSGGTESDNAALWGAYRPGHHVITTRIEHPAILATCKALQSAG